MHRELEPLGASPSPDLGGPTARLATLARLANEAGAPEIASGGIGAGRPAGGGPLLRGVHRPVQARQVDVAQRARRTVAAALGHHPDHHRGDRAALGVRAARARPAGAGLARDRGGRPRGLRVRGTESRQPQGRVAGRGLRAEPAVGARDVSGRYAGSRFGHPRQHGRDARVRAADRRRPRRHRHRPAHLGRGAGAGRGGRRAGGHAALRVEQGRSFDATPSAARRWRSRGACWPSGCARSPARCCRSARSNGSTADDRPAIGTRSSTRCARSPSRSAARCSARRRGGASSG